MIRTISDLYVNGIDTTDMTLEQAFEKWEQVEGAAKAAKKLNRIFKGDKWNYSQNYSQ